MKKILAATLLATAALTTTPASAGCVDDFLARDFGQQIVERHPDGSITIHPVQLAPLVYPVAVLVNCVV